MSSFLAWGRSLLTDEENQWDIGLLLWFSGFCIFLYKAVIAPAPFDYMSFGTGLAGVCGAGAALRWIKTTEIKTHADVVIEERKDGDCHEGEH